YLLVNWAYLRLLGYAAVTNSGALAADAVSRVWPHAGRRFTAAAVAISAFGVLNAQLLSGPRLIYRMAQDGRFFAVFARVSGRPRMAGTESGGAELGGTVKRTRLAVDLAQDDTSTPPSIDSRTPIPAIILLGALGLLLL